MKKIKYKKGYKYKLEEDYVCYIGLTGFAIDTQFIKLGCFGKIIIRKGYSWDGASCAIDTKTFMKGSLIHDALYQLIREKKLPVISRKRCDEILIDICKEDGMNSIRRAYVYKAVRLFGGKAIKPRKVFVAP